MSPHSGILSSLLVNAAESEVDTASQLNFRSVAHLSYICQSDPRKYGLRMSYAGAPAPEMAPMTFAASTLGPMPDGDIAKSEGTNLPPQEAFRAAAMFLSPFKAQIDALWPDDSQ